MDPTPEMRLVLACARLEAVEPEAIARAAQGADWEKTIDFAERHGLTPLLARNLEAAGAIAPRPVHAQLWAESVTTARRNRAMADELAAVRQLLAGSGILSIPFKGPQLARDVFGDLALRSFGDLDLLLRRRNIRAARALLESRGYSPEFPLAPAAEDAFLRSKTQYHFVLRQDRTGLMLELHWRSDRDFPVERDDDGWWQAAARDGLGTDDLLFALCIHGTKHFWASLHWLVDVAELVRARPGIDWDALAARARSLRCTRRIGVGLRLARDLLDLRLPAAATAMAEAPGVERLATRLEVLLRPEPAPLTAWDGLRLELACCEGWRQRARTVVNTIFAPGLVEWTSWPLPRALGFLYGPLRLARLVAKHSNRGTQ